MNAGKLIIPYQNKRGKQKGEETLTDVGSL